MSNRFVDPVGIRGYRGHLLKKRRLTPRPWGFKLVWLDSPGRDLRLSLSVPWRDSGMVTPLWTVKEHRVKMGDITPGGVTVHVFHTLKVLTGAS